MSEKLWRLFLQENPVETKSGAAMRVMELFYQIEEAHGTEQARLLFERWATRPSQSEQNKLKRWRIIERYDAMQIKNQAQLAREIVEANEKLPEDEQLTPSFRPSYPTVYDYIRTLLRERREAVKAGTWDGPGYDPLAAPLDWLKDDEDL
jgi:hypothetical protein